MHSFVPVTVIWLLEVTNFILPATKKAPEDQKEITESARQFYCQLISAGLTLNLKSVNRWASCVWRRVFPFVHVILSSRTGGSVSGEEAVFERFSLLITPQSLHLSVRQPELMDLSADRRTARCQLCSVQPDNTAQCRRLPEMSGWTARLYCRGCVCMCVFFALYGYLFIFVFVQVSVVFFHCWQRR